MLLFGSKDDILRNVLLFLSLQLCWTFIVCVGGGILQNVFFCVPLANDNEFWNDMMVNK